MTDDGRPDWDDTVPRRGDPAAPVRPAVADSVARAALPRHYDVAGEDLEEPVPRADWRLSAWLVGVVTTALAMVCGLTWVVGDASAQEHTGHTLTARRGSTVLVVLTDRSDEAVAAALIGVEGRRATCVVVPTELVVRGPNGDRTSLADAVGASDSTAEAALSRSLGVRVDGTWRLDPQTLARLVDFLGGVTVDLDARVTGKGALVEGTEPGKRLSGEAAAEYAGTLPEKRSQLQRLARFYAVLEGALLELPDDPVRLKRAMETMGDDATTFPRDRFLTVVGQLHDSAQNDEMEDVLLPLVRRSASGPYRVDAAKLEELLDGPLAFARLSVPPGGQVRVLVQSDGGSARRAEEVRTRLMAARLSYVADKAGGEGAAAGSASGLPKRTVIVVPSPSAVDRQRGVDVARALGIPQDRVTVGTIEDGAVDVVLRVGKDLSRLLEDGGA